MRYMTRPLSDRTWLRPDRERKTSQFDATWTKTLTLLGKVARAIEQAWDATITDRLTFEARLARAVEPHARSRTIYARMVREVAELALGRVAEVQAEHAAELAALEQRHAAELATVKATHADEVARIEKSRDDWKGHCQYAQDRLDEKRTIRQELEQSAGADDAKWTVAGLEEVAYRLRTGGAGDDTPVDVEKSRIVAMVPAPNLVQLDASPKAKPPTLPDSLPNRVVKAKAVRFDWRLAGIGGFLLLIALVLRVVGV